MGVIVQFGGQTPLRLARTLEEEGFPCSGTSPDAIDLAEDRGKFAELLRRARASRRRRTARPATLDGGARDRRRRSAIRSSCGPSYVLGGRAMEIVYDDDELETFVRDARPRRRPTTRS